MAGGHTGLLYDRPKSQLPRSPSREPSRAGFMCTAGRAVAKCPCPLLGWHKSSASALGHRTWPWKRMWRSASAHEAKNKMGDPCGDSLTQIPILPHGAPSQAARASVRAKKSRGGNASATEKQKKTVKLRKHIQSRRKSDLI